MSLLLFTLLAIAKDDFASKTSTLQCGAAAFHADSRVRAGADTPLAPVSQTLTVKSSGGRSSRVPLDPSRTVAVDGRTVMNAYLSTWSCVRADDGVRYVQLGYVCSVDPGYPHDCGGDKEWFRIVDLRGRRRDAGLPHDGPAVARLHRRLKLERTLSAGVQMKSVLDD